MSAIKYYIWLVSFLTIAVACNSQSFTYKNTNNTYAEFVNPNLETKNIEDYLPTEYVKDGSVDYTEYIQKAIDENYNIAFPNFPILINDKGIKLKSNSNVFFNKNSCLILKPTNKEKYSLIHIYNTENVNLYNPRLIGDRKGHKGKQGEWGMGIRIHDSKNVKIYNVDIKDMWGDGIYITSYTESKSDNVVIKNGQIDNTRRNGISVISGRNITIDKVLISNTNGAPPAAGIDVEPNKYTDVIQNLTLTNILTVNNQRDGIIMDFTNLTHKQNSDEVTIRISNHEDRGSRYALRFAAFRKSKKSDKALKGKIIVENAKWDNSRMKDPFRIGEKSEQFPQVILKNIRTNLIDENQFNERVRGMIKSRKQFQLN